jgi:hypothetical protein
VGLVSYLAILVYALFALLKRLPNRLPLRNALLPAIVLVAAHTFVDFEMSFEFFAVVFYILLVVIAVSLPDNANILPKLQKPGEYLVRSVTVVMLLVTLTLCAGTTAGFAAIDEAVNQDDTIQLEKLTQAVSFGITVDPLHAASYKLSYVSLLAGEDVPAKTARLAADFAGDLEPEVAESAAACKALVDYNYYNGDFDKALYYTQAMIYTRPHDVAIYDAALEICDALQADASTEQQAKAIKLASAITKAKQQL